MIGRRPHKWIDARIAELDPDTDWAEIYRLSNTYRPTDPMLDLIYAHVFPHFMVPAHGAIPVWRNGVDAKVVTRAAVRADDTNWHNMIWWYYGPDHPETRKSVDTVNKIHAHYAKDYPDGFGHHYDYVHVWCFSAATMHRLRLKMGLPGLTEKEQVAAHRFWLEMGKLFVVPGDSGPRHPVDDYPEDFDGVLAWLDEFESRDWPVNPIGAATSKAVLEQYLHHNFPRPLRPLMRAVVTSFYADSVVRAYQLSPPPAPVSWVLRRLCGVAMGLAERFGSDPTESYVERRLARSAAESKEQHHRRRDLDDQFADEFRSWIAESGPTSSAAACPHLMNAASTADS